MPVTSEALDALVSRAQRTAERPIVLIDGGSGAGKTSVARALAARWAGDVQLVSLDACYPGWDGLAAASEMVAASILDPVRPGYWGWDWASNAPSEWVSLNTSHPLIIEGCGALTPRNRALASLGIWCELDAAIRKQRALARDGETFAREWDRWEAQEEAHWLAHRPRDLADVTLWTD